MEAILRYLSGQIFEIDRDWAIGQLYEVLMLQQSGADLDYFEKQKLQFRQIDFFNEGQFIGTDLDDIRPGSIAKIRMSGTMMVNDGLCHDGMVSMDKRLRSLYRNSAVNGIIFEVHSRGGLADAGSILYNTLEDRNKPVVVYTTFLGSAAVKGTLPSEEIIAASESTTIGSIGTMISISKEFLEMYKEDSMDLYSTLSPNKNGEFRALLNGDNEPMIKSLTDNDQLFMKSVKKNRPLKGTAAEKRETLSGSTFNAVEAKRRGLIDGIGTFNYALKRLNSHI